MVLTTEKTTVKCNVCGNPTLRMVSGKDAPGIAFECPCGQRVSYGISGWGQTVLPRLYPSPLPKKLYAEYGEHQRSEWIFWSEIELVSDLKIQEEHAKRVVEADDALQRFKDEYISDDPPSIWGRITRFGRG